MRKLSTFTLCSGGFTPYDADTPVTASGGEFRTPAPVQQPFDLVHRITSAPVSHIEQ